MRTTIRDTEGVSRVTGHVLNTGVILAGTGFVVSKTATGQYTIRIPRSVGLIHATATPDASPGQTANVGTFTSDSFVVYTYSTSTGAASDAAFFFEAKYRT